eukprot:COSAG05_NODE_10012_length_588_cov_0.957055_1_plen_139_part_10
MSQAAAAAAAAAAAEASHVGTGNAIKEIQDAKSKRAAEQKIKDILAELATDPEVIEALSKGAVSSGSGPEPEPEPEPQRNRSRDSVSPPPIVAAGEHLNLGGPFGQSPLLLPGGVSVRHQPVVLVEVADGIGAEAWDFT